MLIQVSQAQKLKELSLPMAAEELRQQPEEDGYENWGPGCGTNDPKYPGQGL